MKLEFKEKIKEESFQQLQKSVSNICLNKNQRKINYSAIFIGGMALIAFLSGLFILWYASTSPLIYLSIIVFLGIINVPLILIIGHGSIHKNFSNLKKINKLGENIFYLLGTSPYFWKLRHLNAHHHYTNIRKWDLDIEQSKLIRLSASQECYNIHKYQTYYMPFLFMMYTLNWFFFRDLLDINKQKFGNRIIENHPSVKIFWLFFSKLWHISILIIIPITLGQSVSIVILGFFIYHFSASLTTTLVLVSTHIGEDHELVETGEQSKLPYTWIEHQIRTSGSFSIKSKVILHFFGGFNHHLAHHLFPNIPYTLYPQISPIIKEYCIQNNLPFVCYPNFSACVKSHFKRLAVYSK